MTDFIYSWVPHRRHDTYSIFMMFCQGCRSATTAFHFFRPLRRSYCHAHFSVYESFVKLHSEVLTFISRSTYLPGNLEKWEGFSVKFTESLQIAIWCWWHENLPHLSTEKILFWTRIWRCFLNEIEMFSVMTKSLWDILYVIPTIWPPAAPCKVQLFLWGKPLQRVSGRLSAEWRNSLWDLHFHCHNK